jgi:hypothetical protein
MSSLLNDISDNIMVIDITPQMYTHRLFTVEQRVRYTPYLPEDYIRYRPRITVLLQGSDVETDGLLNDVVLAVGNKERPVREMHDARHDHHACEEGCVVE